MKNYIYILALSTSLFFFTSGCGSTPKQTIYRTTGTTIVTVESAMKGWNDYCATGQQTVGEELRVKGAYEKYQLIMRVSRTLLASPETPENVSNLEKALLALETARADLLKLIFDLTNKKK